MQMSTTTHSSFDQYCISHKTIQSSSSCCIRPWSPPWVPHDIISVFAHSRNKSWRRHCMRCTFRWQKKHRRRPGGEFRASASINSVAIGLSTLNFAHCVIYYSRWQYEVMAARISIKKFLTYRAVSHLTRAGHWQMTNGGQRRTTASCGGRLAVHTKPD